MSGFVHLILRFCIWLERFIIQLTQKGGDDDMLEMFDNDTRIDSETFHSNQNNRNTVHEPSACHSDRADHGTPVYDQTSLHVALLEDSTTLPSSSWTATTMVPSRRKSRHKFRYWIFFCLLLLLEMGYYYFSLVFAPNNKSQNNNNNTKLHQLLFWIGWEMISLLIALRCIATCPIHLMLRSGDSGHNNQHYCCRRQHQRGKVSHNDHDPKEDELEEQHMYQGIGTDPATTGILFTVVVLGSSQVLLDFLKLYGSGSVPSDTAIWIWLSYLPFCLLNSITFYLPFLTVLVSLRISLIRLYSLDEQIQQKVNQPWIDASDLTRAFPRTDSQCVTSEIPFGYSTTEIQSNLSIDTLATHEDDHHSINEWIINEEDNQQNRHSADISSWLRQYESIRQSLNQTFSKQVAPWFCWVLLMMFIELTTFYIPIVQDLFHQSSSHPIQLKVAVTGYYFSYVMALGLSLSQLSRSVCICRQTIGPKVSILAVQYPQQPRYSLLSFAIATYPVQVHLGSLPMEPHHAITAVVSTVGAYLVIMGYR